MRLHALQYLRAVAALAVVYSHTAIQVDDYTKYLLDAGSFGVDIFFVISGFIMIYIARPEDTPKRFFNNRVRRVVPLYWFFTILMACILITMPWAFKSTYFGWDSFLLSLAFIPHWSTAHENMVWPLVAPGWSLVFEMYFYSLFALSLLLAERYRILFISLIITMVFLVANHYHTGESAMAQFFAKSLVFEFVLGMLLAVAWKRGFKLPSSTAVYLLLFSSCLLFLELPVPRIFEYGIPAAFIVMACLYIKIGVHKWAVLLGDASYALYLSHIFTLGALRKFIPPLLGDGPLAAYLFAIISLVVCTIVSIFIHQYIDNWLLRKERLRFLKLPDKDQNVTHFAAK
ncbi:MAG: acyltransferase [Granulosicoccus sp.]|nr:acyltransferase [Granulosicoccus sp.]